MHGKTIMPKIGCMLHVCSRSRFRRDTYTTTFCPTQVPRQIIMVAKRQPDNVKLNRF